MSLSNKSILAQTNSTANLTEHNMRVLRASMNGKPAGDAHFLSETVKTVAEEMNLERKDALHMLKAFVEMELKADDANVANHWQSHVSENLAVDSAKSYRLAH